MWSLDVSQRKYVVLNCNSVYKLYFVGGCKSLVFLDVSHRKEAVAFNCVIFCRCMRRHGLLSFVGGDLHSGFSG